LCKHCRRPLISLGLDHLAFFFFLWQFSFPVFLLPPCPLPEFPLWIGPPRAGRFLSYSPPFSSFSRPPFSAVLPVRSLFFSRWKAFGSVCVILPPLSFISPPIPKMVPRTLREPKALPRSISSPGSNPTVFFFAVPGGIFLPQVLSTFPFPHQYILPFFFCLVFCTEKDFYRAPENAGDFFFSEFPANPSLPSSTGLSFLNEPTTTLLFFFPPVEESVGPNHAEAWQPLGTAFGRITPLGFRDDLLPPTVPIPFFRQDPSTSLPPGVFTLYRPVFLEVPLPPIITISPRFPSLQSFPFSLETLLSCRSIWARKCPRLHFVAANIYFPPLVLDPSPTF